MSHASFARWSDVASRIPYPSLEMLHQNRTLTVVEVVKDLWPHSRAQTVVASLKKFTMSCMLLRFLSLPFRPMSQGASQLQKAVLYKIIIIYFIT